MCTEKINIFFKYFIRLENILLTITPLLRERVHPSSGKGFKVHVSPLLTLLYCRVSAHTEVKEQSAICACSKSHSLPQILQCFSFKQIRRNDHYLIRPSESISKQVNKKQNSM